MYLPLGSFTGIVGMFPYFLYWKIFNVFYLKLILQNLKGMFNVPFPIINTYISSARGFKFLSASSQSNVKYFSFSFLSNFFPIYCQSYHSMILMALSNLDLKCPESLLLSHQSLQTFLPLVSPKFPIRDNHVQFNFILLKIASNQFCPPSKCLYFSRSV